MKLRPAWRRVMWRSLLICVSMIATGLAAWPQQVSATTISTVSIFATFSDSAGNQYVIPSNPVPSLRIPIGTSRSFEFLVPGDFVNVVTFDVKYIRTDQISENHYSDIVTIKYTLSGAAFVGRAATLIFDGHDTSGALMDVDAVLDYTKLLILPPIILPGFVLTSPLLPAKLASFEAFEDPFGVYQLGAPATGFFTLDYSFTTPLPAALPLFASGLGALGLIAHLMNRKQA